MDRTEILGEDFFSVARDALYVVLIVFLGLTAIFTWNHNSLNLGISVLNTPLIRGGTLLAVLVGVLKLDIYLSEED